jgi:Fe-S cluster biogenesis protein NfuA
VSTVERREGRDGILAGLHPSGGDLLMPTETVEAGVAEAIEAIRPALQADGGDIVLNRVDDDGVVHVTLVGACGTCPVSTMTLKAGVERIIKDRVPEVTEVVSE